MTLTGCGGLGLAVVAWGRVVCVHYTWVGMMSLCAIDGVGETIGSRSHFTWRCEILVKIRFEKKASNRL